MDERNQNEQNRPDHGTERPYEQQGYGRPDTGWGRTYRDPYTGKPQNGWQRKRDPAAGPSASDDERAYSILSYIGILWLVGLLVDGKNQKVLFHVNQGIILSIFEFALGFFLAIAEAIVRGVFGFAFGGIGILSWMGNAVSGLLSFLGWGFVVSYIIIGVVHAAQGRREPLPLIGNLFTVVR